jgi:hypothetical protein
MVQVAWCKVHGSCPMVQVKICLIISFSNILNSREEISSILHHASCTQQLLLFRTPQYIAYGYFLKIEFFRTFIKDTKSFFIYHGHA